MVEVKAKEVKKGLSSYELMGNRVDAAAENEKKHQVFQKSAIELKKQFTDKFILNNTNFSKSRLVRRHLDAERIKYMDRLKGKVKRGIRNQYIDQKSNVDAMSSKASGGDKFLNEISDESMGRSRTRKEIAE